MSRVPSVMEVACCGDCPFLEASGTVVHRCYHDGASSGATFEDLDTRPRWCPLDVAPTLVRVTHDGSRKLGEP